MLSMPPIDPSVFSSFPTNTHHEMMHLKDFISISAVKPSLLLDFYTQALHMILVNQNIMSTLR